MNLFWLAGHAMAARLDAGVGMLIALLLMFLFGMQDLPWWHYAALMLTGSVFALFPDFDIVFHILRRKKVHFDHHQTFMHRPVLTLTIVPLLMYALGGPFFAALAFTGILWHYVHDTDLFGGGGIAWLWPLSNIYWGFRGGVDPKDIVLQPDYYKRWLNAEWFTVLEVLLGATFTALALLLVYGSLLLMTAQLILEFSVLYFIWHLWAQREAAEV